MKVSAFRRVVSGLGCLLLALSVPSVARAQLSITNASGYVITWDGNSGVNAGAPGMPVNLARATGAVVYASGELGPSLGLTYHYTTNLNDGRYGNSNSWIGAAGAGPWFAGVQFAAAGPWTGLAWGRDNTGVFQDRCLGTYTLQYSTNAVFSTNAADWITVGTVTFSGSGGGFKPWLRHRFTVGRAGGGRIVAAGVRVLVPEAGTAIDELEASADPVFPVAWWRMGDGQPGVAQGATAFSLKELADGPPLVTVASPAFINGVPPRAANRVGSAWCVEFFGANYGTNAVLAGLQDNFGLELWVRPIATNGTQCLAYNGGSSSNGWGLFLEGGRYRGLFGGVGFLGSAPALPGVWTHLALVRDNGTNRLFVDGIAVGTNTLVPAVATGRFGVGSPPQLLTGEFLLGDLDEVRVFSFAPGSFSEYNLLYHLAFPTEAVTSPALAVSSSSMTLAGLVNPGNLPTTAWFEWGETTNHGNATPAVLLAATNAPVAISATLTGLTVGVTYHFRAVSSNALAMDFGTNRSFIPPAFTNVPIAGLGGVEAGEVAWGDYDNDGRLDFLITGQGTTRVAQIWRNTPTGFSNVTAQAAPGLRGVAEASVAWADPNRDGLLGFAIAGATNTFQYVTEVWESDGTQLTRSRSLTGIGRGAVAWGDYNDDGWLDLFVNGLTNTSRSSPFLWRQVSGNYIPQFVQGLPGILDCSAMWADYDNDGYQDLILSGTTNALIGSNYTGIWRSDGSTLVPTNVPGIPGRSEGTVAWGDYDNDGRLDFVVGGYSGPTVVWRNTGAGFTNSGVVLPQLSDGSATWGDFDNDGRLDLILSGRDGSRFLGVWRNTGAGFVPLPVPGLPGVDRSSVACADFDNDGRLDFLVLGNTGSSAVAQLWRNILPETNAPPSAPNNLVATKSGSGVVLSWNAATDDLTPSAGLSYNVRAGTFPGGGDLLSTHAAATGFRRVPALGNAGLRRFLILDGVPLSQPVYWSVQAVDSSFAGGPFASEVSYIEIRVTTNADGGAGSLRLAATAAVQSKHVSFDPALAGQTITLTNGMINLLGLTTIEGPPGPGGVTVSGNDASPIFHCFGGSRTVLRNLTLAHGRAVPGGSGGAISNGGTLTISNCTLRSSRAGDATAPGRAGRGGGIYSASFSSLTILNSTICSNAAGNSAFANDGGGWGGGIYLTNGSLVIQNSTLAHNAAGTGQTVGSTGGGLFSDGGNVAVSCATIVSNTAQPDLSGTLSPAGGIGHNALLRLTNSIVAGNTATGVVNLMGTFSGRTNFLAGDPGLSPLRLQGGAHPTMEPLEGSLVIDAGLGEITNSFTIDQRGFRRRSGPGVDIGATELRRLTLTVTQTGDAGPGSLREAVSLSESNGLVQFAPALAGQTILLTSGPVVFQGTLTVDGSSLPGGAIVSAGGARRVFTVMGGHSVRLDSLVIRDGNAALEDFGQNLGGGILCLGNLSLTNCVVAANRASAGSGGGLANLGGTIVLHRTLFLSNSAGMGGGLVHSGGSVTAHESTFHRNTAATEGGAIRSSAPLTLSLSTVSENTVSAGSGGGISASHSPIVHQCTLSGNRVITGSGGAIHSTVNVVLRQSTVSGNSAGFAGGGINISGSTSSTLATNCILAGNLAQVGADVVGPFAGASNFMSLDPLLAPLGRYGGPTATMPPRLGSPALDAGLFLGLPTDQRGFPRVAGVATDLGAVEGGLNTSFVVADVIRLGDGNVRFGFTNLSGPVYRILASTNVAAPPQDWIPLGPALESPAGVFQFTDLDATNHPHRFYRVTVP